MKNICLLGATGSIGKSTLDIIRANPQKYCLKAFSFYNNIEEAKKIIKEFSPLLVSTPKKEHLEVLKNEFPNIIFSLDINDVARFKVSSPCVINALVGSAGLVPTIEAIKAGRDVLLANKETLVMAGELVMRLAKDKGVNIIPIDSEHSAIFQILNDNNRKEVKRVIITASGGALYHKTLDELKDVTVEDALKHPTWQMGAKITIDSATMVNKAFEVIEAYHLFNLKLDQISTIIHPESIVHSMVEFNDHSIFAQMGVSDMRIPIQYALNYPHHIDNQVSQELDFTKPFELHFKPMDKTRFKILALVGKVISLGKFYPVVFNASNEKLVSLFLEGKITFDKIVTRIEEEINKTEELYGHLTYNLENILKVDELVKTSII
ncbi:MAG: 1-deoxy-D-xylulose-5-phosphate reductoisomerase [Bacilli bacterium]|nr:1-deoxy-D-xylulose-5-phosphate reductoisomerase [Bacilli bacterium]